MSTFELEQRRDLLQKALDKWGSLAQIDMAVEECSELIQAIQKYKRRQTEDNSQHILEEMADLYIMLGQLELLFDTYSETMPDLNEWLIRKLNRLQNRLEK